jgi:hypothetical protein
LSPESRETHRRAQLQHPGLLTARDVDGFVKTGFRLRLGAGC